MLADIGPGVRVFESGVGSGALSMTMLRWGASIVGYELREDFANRARTNVRAFLGEDALARYDVSLRDSYAGIDERDLDRVVLDLPEPWQVVPHARDALRPGGILVAYTPSIIQVSAAARRVGHQGLECPPVVGGAPSRLARRRARRAAGPSDGGPHRVPHDARWLG